jgi:hypothetical protein
MSSGEGYGVSWVVARCLRWERYDGDSRVLFRRCCYLLGTSIGSNWSSYSEIGRYTRPQCPRSHVVRNDYHCFPHKKSCLGSNLGELRHRQEKCMDKFRKPRLANHRNCIMASALSTNYYTLSQQWDREVAEDVSVEIIESLNIV